MAIPISDYIDISSTVLQSLVGDRDFCGLVFTTDAMTTTDAFYDDKKTDFTAGKAVTLSYNGVVACFGVDSTVAKFAAKYFSYNGAAGTPRVLNVAKYTAGSEASAYATATEEFTNFGSFTFLGAAPSALTGIEPSNAVLVVPVDADDDYPDDFAGMEYVHCVLGNLEGGANYAAWMPMAWMASVDYTQYNTAGTMNYKRFGGESATISTSEGKVAADEAKMNYIGRVQAYGTMLQFYQKGVNQNGVDLGIIRDKMWIQSAVEAGWFNLAGNANRIPANSDGAQMVYSMVLGVAMQGVENGCILTNKGLSAEKQTQVVQYTNTAAAIEAVQTTGYYISAQVVEDGSDFVCRYVLVYSKGDHIAKVVGQHVLV